MVAAVINGNNKSESSHDDVNDDDDGSSWVKNTPKKSPGGTTKTLQQAEKKEEQGFLSKTRQPNHHKQQQQQRRGGRGGDRAAKNDRQSNLFGKRSWVKPSSTSPSSLPEESSVTKVVAKEEVEEQQQQQQQEPPNSLAGLVSQQRKDVAQNDIGARDDDHDALTTAMIGTVAAVSLVTGLNGFGVVHDDNDDDHDNDKHNSNVTASVSATVKKKPESMSFQEQCRQHLIHTLMEDYGEFDPSWKEQQPPSSQPTALGAVDSTLETTTTIAKESDDTNITSSNEKNYGTSRLGQHGKAPIHVELTSFGYKYGAPGASKKQQGWSHAQPLAPFDCRHVLQPVPSYLAWRDGLNGQVKRALLSAGDNKNTNKNNNKNDHEDENDNDDYENITIYTQHIANEISKALIEAINDGGHGYANPLKMIIYVGSELGRHRSVVVCELAATALRKLLRANYNDCCFQQPCSVGTRHLHLDKKQSDTTTMAAGAAARSKKKNNTNTDDDVAYENNKLGNW